MAAEQQYVPMMNNSTDANQRDTALARLLAMHAALQANTRSDVPARSVSNQFSTSSNGSTPAVSRSNTTGSPGLGEMPTSTYTSGLHQGSSGTRMPDTYPLSADNNLIHSSTHNSGQFPLDSPNGLTGQYSLWDATPIGNSPNLPNTGLSVQALSAPTLVQNSALANLVDAYHNRPPTYTTSHSSMMNSKESITMMAGIHQQPTDSIPAHMPMKSPLGTDTGKTIWTSTPASAFPAQQRMVLQRDNTSMVQPQQQQLVSGPPAIQDPTSTSASLYVKNLPPEFDELALYQTFAPYGALLSCKVALDPTTNKCKGVGFVNFVERDCALRAMAQLHGVRISEGRNLALALQAPKAVRNGGAPGVPSMGSFGNAASMGTWQQVPACPTALPNPPGLGQNRWYVVA